MGNRSKASSALEASGGRGRKKKKGRPSLLDLQKRSLRLQQQQEEEQASLKRKRRDNSHNPYLKFNSGRRSTRRNLNPNPSDEEEDDDDEEEDERAARKEKKLRLVLDNNDMTDKRVNSSAKATREDPEPSGSGPTTPLPDKKLLVFILDRLQKKDTYGVFSEPVDPEELPDYHDIIESPMDFQTVREKLHKGLYANLEQFESDVFLICSNAMLYNSSGTIYHRQARTIQEMARKDFANLRSDSDTSEHQQVDPQPKPTPARRGRPPKNPPAADHVAGHDLSPDAGLSNAAVPGPSGRPSMPLFGLDSLRRGPQSFGAADLAVGRMGRNGPYGLRILENNNGSNSNNNNNNNNSWLLNQLNRVEKNDDFSGGFGTKRGWIKGEKKLAEIDDSRRSIYEYPLTSVSYQDPPIFNTFDAYPNILLPVGLQHQHSYTQSLSRFASKLGPTAQRIVTNRINQLLPPGAQLELDGPHSSQLTASSPSANSSPQPATPTAAQTAATPDPILNVAATRPVAVPKLNMHFQMHGCANLNLHGFNSNVSNNSNNIFLKNGEMGLNLNLGFQSPDSSDQKQQPDLALQL